MSRLAGISTLGALLALGLLACSENSNNAPTCPAGYAPDALGRCCTPQGSCLGATPCGANTTQQAGGGCSCIAPFADCNGNIGLPGGDGCECNGQCSGGQCNASICDPATKSACGSQASFCEAISLRCTSCPAGKHDCDGLGTNGCESDDASCGGGAGQCSATAANACPSHEQYCDSSQLTCQPCPSGMHNCDGLGPCESTKDCAPSGCEASCQEENQIYCVRDPARNNLCTPCLEDAHCRANPSSRGPFCDTAKNLCYCKTAADCAGDRRGSICKEAGSVKSCSCDDDIDCKVPEYTKCSPTVFGNCIKPCKTTQDCDDPVNEYCDVESGLCY